MTQRSFKTGWLPNGLVVCSCGSTDIVVFDVRDPRPARTVVCNGCGKVTTHRRRVRVRGGRHQVEVLEENVRQPRNVEVEK